MQDNIDDLPSEELEDIAGTLKENVQQAEELRAEQPSAEQELGSAGQTLQESSLEAEHLKAEQELPAHDMNAARETLRQSFLEAEELKQQHDTATEIGHDLQAQGVHIPETDNTVVIDGNEIVIPEVTDDATLAVETDEEIVIPDASAVEITAAEEAPPVDPPMEAPDDDMEM